MPTYIVLLGPPGSGKGTQARLIAEKFGLPHVSTGDLFRAMKTQDTPLAHKVQEILASGALVPDDVTIEIVKERLSRPDCQPGATLDGFPRTVNQADALESFLKTAFNSRVSLAPLLVVGEEEAVRRIMGRARQESRTDDAPDVAEKRFEVYQTSTAPLIEYYARKGVLARINGDQSVARVTADLMLVVEQQVRAGRAAS